MSLSPVCRPLLARYVWRPASLLVVNIMEHSWDGSKTLEVPEESRAPGGLCRSFCVEGPPPPIYVVPTYPT